MIRAADCSVGMMIISSELLISHNMIFTRNLKSQQQSPWQQERNLHHFSWSVLNYLGPKPVGLQELHIRSFNSGRDFAKLGLPENASKAEVKSAYFSLAKKLHPDNGGNAKEFNEITEAYKRLSSDSLYGDQNQHSGYNNQDLRWMEEMERRRIARMWMEQRMMEEEWARRRAQQNQWQGWLLCTDFARVGKKCKNR